MPPRDKVAFRLSDLSLSKLRYWVVTFSLLAGITMGYSITIFLIGNHLVEEGVGSGRTSKTGKSIDMPETNNRIQITAVLPEENVERVAFEDGLGEWFEKVEALEAYLDVSPDFAIPEMTHLSPWHWMNAARGRPLETDADFRIVLFNLRSEAKNIVAMKMTQAIRSLDIEGVSIGYLSRDVVWRAVEEAVGSDALNRYNLFHSNGSQDAGEDKLWIFEEDKAIDPIWNSRLVVASDGSFQLKSSNGRVRSEIVEAFENYRNRNGVAPASIEELNVVLLSPEMQVIGDEVFDALTNKISSF